MGIVAFLEGQFASALLAAILFGSIMGFLKYNFHPAKIFMGDTGSMFLGFCLSVIAIEGLTKGATVISIFIPVVILGIPIFDTAFAIIRRFVNGQPIFQADKEHLHHRLLDLGLSHKQTVLAIYFISIILSTSAVLLAKLSTEQGTLILIILSMAVIIITNRIKVRVVKNKVSHTFPKNNKFHDYGG
jgi:UDP-GlcNAc:undecaprenyl-phosphate GlcNAc-1-phosphate transferase